MDEEDILCHYSNFADLCWSHLKLLETKEKKNSNEVRKNRMTMLPTNSQKHVIDLLASLFLTDSRLCCS